jgi:ComF family protein
VKARSGGVDQIRSAAAYTDIAVLIVAKLKFSKRTEYAPLIAAAMAETLASTGWTFDIVTWVPLHSTRQRERGFNQSQILARQIARAYPTINCTRLLKRIRPTKSQARLKRKERLTNLAGAFAAAGKTPFSGKSILLIDDVCTTGSTINECARTLKSHGASTVYGLTFARADM